MRPSRLLLIWSVVVAATAMHPAGAIASRSDAPSFVTAAYVDFLGRGPSDGELAIEVRGLLAGGPAAAMVGRLASSPAWTSTLVERFYRETFGRPGDPAGVAYWAGLIRSGQRSVTEVASGFYASAEYYARTGGLDPRWVADLYRVLLHRSPDRAGLEYWTAETAATGRPAVALALYQSPESLGLRADRLYRTLLGRSADAAGLTSAMRRIHAAGDIAFAVDLASSGEYRARAGDRYPVDGIVVGGRDPSLEARVLTSDPGDRYDLTVTSTGVRARAPASNTDGNTRIVFASASAPVLRDQQSCATWSSETSPLDQQGAVLRMRSTGGSDTRAITVTKNMYFGATWIFNVHLWDTAEELFIPVAAFDLTSAFRRGSTSLPLPWRLCARVVDRTVSVRVWPVGRPEPRWGDRRWGGSAHLPPGWDQPGVAGWYIGHLLPGEETTFEDMRAGAVPVGDRVTGTRGPTTATPRVATATTPASPGG